MKTNKPDAALLWKQLDDVLVPRLGLNLGDRVVYANLLRQSRLEGKRQLRFSIRRLAHETHMSHTSARHAVRRLVAKGALRLVDRTQAGHRVEVFIPEEIPDAPREVPVAASFPRRRRSASFEEMNFQQVKIRREAIHERDGGLCFYCLSQLSPGERCLDHVVPQVRGGTNTYRNLVSCCVECNAQKGQTAAQDFLRSLFRQRRLSAAELEDRLHALDALATGKLCPILAPPAVPISKS